MAVYDRITKDGVTKLLADGVNIASSAESSTTAAYAHAIGEYFTLSGVLHKATAAIAVGDTITVGTNCVQAQVADETLKNDKKQLGIAADLDARVNAMHALVNYGYDVPYEGTATGGTGDAAYNLSIKRLGTTLTFNGNCGSSGTGLRVQLNTETMRAGTSNLGGGIQLIDGHKYRLRQHIISGSATVAPRPDWTLPTDTQKIGTNNPVTDTNGDLCADITYDATTYANGLRMLVFLARTSGNTINNLVVQYTLEDLTATELLPIMKRIVHLEAIFDFLVEDEQIDLTDMED